MKYIHKTTGKVYHSRLEAKLDMGSAYFNLAWKRKEFELVREDGDDPNLEEIE